MWLVETYVEFNEVKNFLRSKEVRDGGEEEEPLQRASRNPM